MGTGDERSIREQQESALVWMDEQAEQHIRRVWHQGRWWFSIIDVVGMLTDAPKPRMYWADMKRNVQAEGFVEVLEKIQQLKMRAPDGKQRFTDAGDAKTVLRIVQSIPSPKAEPLKQWLAKVGAERLEEIENPAQAADRLRTLYRQRGYTDEWIEQRIQGIVVRDELTTEWKERGAEEGREFALLTDILQHGTFDISIDEHKAVKSLKRSENLRDNMTTLELALTMLSEATSTVLHQTRDSQGFLQLQRDARRAGEIAGAARQEIEAESGVPVVSRENAKTLTARAVQPRLFAPEAEPGG